LTRKTEYQSKYSSDADRGRAGPDADRLGALLAREDVGDDRQRRRHDQRPADAHDGADRDELGGGLDEEDGEAREAEERDAGLQRALAAEAVAEGPEREQQAGEGDEVGVDHPLQRRAGGAEVLLQRRERDVEDGVVEPDDHEAQGKDAEGLPASFICEGSGHAAMVRSRHPRRIERFTSPTP
jgi:hypothetical protein